MRLFSVCINSPPGARMLVGNKVHMYIHVCIAEHKHIDRCPLGGVKDGYVKDPRKQGILNTARSIKYHIIKDQFSNPPRINCPI